MVGNRGTAKSLHKRYSSPHGNSSNGSHLYSFTSSCTYSLHKLFQLAEQLLFTMELPPFSIEQLSQLLTSNAPPSQLVEVLSRYESDAILAAADSSSMSANSQLLSLFYSSFFFAHLLTEQMSVHTGHSGRQSLTGAGIRQPRSPRNDTAHARSFAHPGSYLAKLPGTTTSCLANPTRPNLPDPPPIALA